MSSLWTPGGEHPVGRPRSDAPPAAPPPPSGPPHPPGDGGAREPTDADLDALRQQLAAAPVEVVVANHAYAMFELAALHLSLDPPQLDKARFAIDALGALVSGLEGRLGDAEQSLKEGLAQLRLAFVQLSNQTGQGNHRE
jgi:hypothetical protein